jgi:tol-pal system protein YbgF
MKNQYWLVSTLALVVTPLMALSQAPVVDGSENFTLLGNQAASGAAYQNPAPIVYGQEQEQPLAKEAPTTFEGDNVRLLDKIQGLQQEIQELRGQLEVQTHELKTLKSQQLDFYKDLDNRIRGNSGAKATPPEKLSLDSQPMPNSAESASLQAPQAPTSTINPAALPTPANNTSLPQSQDEQSAYLRAYDLIQTKNFPSATLAMEQFIATYPQGSYSANAHYWLGELYLTQNKPKDAIQHFNVVLSQFPNSNKAAPSMLKLGYAYAANGQVPEARQQLQQVISNYPDTQTAKLAITKLSTLPRS